MKYKYVGNGDHFQGLPANDIDDDDLTPEQKVLLETALAVGMYTIEKSPTLFDKKKVVNEVKVESKGEVGKETS